MSNNIFLSLSSYPYNPEHTQRENQHTRIFGYLLNSNKALQLHIFRELVKNKTQLLNGLNPNELSEVLCFPTEQYRNSPVFPDMKISTTNRKLTIFVENKIDSKEGLTRDNPDLTQLTKYLKLAHRTESEQCWVIYLTKNHEDLAREVETDPCFAGQHSWAFISDVVHKYFSSQKEIGSPQNRLTHEFLVYLEGNGLSGTKGFKTDYSKAWQDYNAFYEIVDEYLDKVTSRFEALHYTQQKKETGADYFYRIIAKPKWNPGKLDGFWFNLGFGLESDDNGQWISVGAELGIRKKYYALINEIAYPELLKGLVELDKMGFKKVYEANPIIFGRYKELSSLTNNFQTGKEAQINKILSCMEGAVKELESSTFLQLLQSNLPKVKSRKV